MNPILQALLNAWRRVIPVITRIGRDLAQWSSQQSWSRLAILSILALIAQSIVRDHILQNDRNTSTTVEASDHHGKVKKEKDKNKDDGSDSFDPDEADIHISKDGIVIRGRSHNPALPTAPLPGAAPSTPGTPAAPGTPGSAGGAGTPSQSADANGAQPASGDGKAPAQPAAGTPGESERSVVIGPGGTVTVTKDGKVVKRGTTHDENGDDDDDEDSDDDAPPLKVTQKRVHHWFGETLEGAVLLLIVYLIAAKIVVRKTAASDARAAEAEASAAAAATAAEREALERQLAQAELQTLQAQVEPHFLFNTLASVDYLIETDPARASAMQKNLIQYLRAALPQMRGMSSQLGREAALSRAYLEILKVRMEDRLQVVIDVPEGLQSAEFPPMMLQTLVENAIQHGVEPKPEGGEIRLSARVVDGRLEVEVADTGIGLAGNGNNPTAGGGVGLANVRERLARLYGGEASFALESRQPVGTRATIRIPYRIQTEPRAAAAPG